MFCPPGDPFSCTNQPICPSRNCLFPGVRRGEHMQVNAPRQVETTLDGGFDQSFKMDERHLVFCLKKIRENLYCG
jgi:hypothetical protein